MSLKNGTSGVGSQGVGLMDWVITRPLICWVSFFMASGGQEEPFSRLALAVHCDESSLILILKIRISGFSDEPIGIR